MSGNNNTNTSRISVIFQQGCRICLLENAAVKINNLLLFAEEGHCICIKMSSLQLFRRATLQLQQLTVRMMSGERDLIVGSRHPNTFGTLGHESAKLVMASLPEEAGDFERVNFVDGVEGKTRLGPAFKYCRLIKKHLNRNELKEALAVYEERMKNERVTPDRYTFNLLISGCAAKGYSKKAFQLFNQMKKRSVPFSESTYTSLFNACANTPFPELGLKCAVDLRELMKEKGHLPNERTYHAMIKAFGRCGSLELSFNVVDEMIDRKMFVSNSTFNFLLQACASNSVAGFRHSIMVWRIMRSRKIKPTIYSYNTLLRCVRDCSIGSMEDIEREFNIMPPPPTRDQTFVESGTNSEQLFLPEVSIPSQGPQLSTETSPSLLSPNQLGSVISLNKVKHPWQRLGLIGGLQGFLSTMADNKVAPNIKTFTLLLETIEPTNEAEQELMEMMKTMNVKWDLDFINLLIRKRAVFGRFDDAKAAFDMIKAMGRKPNIITFGVLALACRNFTETKQLLALMEDLNFRPNIEIIGSLFMRSSKTYDLEMMTFVLAKMRQLHIKPNKRFLVHIETFEKKVAKLYELMKRKDYGNIIVTPKFEEDYKKMTERFLKVKNSEIEDDSCIHPWAQFKLSKVPGKMAGA